MSYDVIGDVHGEHDKLVVLLGKLGYRQTSAAWRHPERKAIFVGDFIDRGPEQVETVKLVRSMTDAGSALAVMGNHEFNAIAWFTPDPANPGEFLRPHFSERYGSKNREQHAAFLAEVEDGSKLHNEFVSWFLTLPLWLELRGLRVVHACWHQRFMEYLRPKLREGDLLGYDLLIEATREPPEEEKDSPEPSAFKAIEALLKGIEVPLPNGYSFRDKDGFQRSRVRVRWWDSDADTYPKAALLRKEWRDRLPASPVPSHVRIGYDGELPVFVGHYWLPPDQRPTPLSEKVGCVDYSAAKGGPLVAYRWEGEAILRESNFVTSSD